MKKHIKIVSKFRFGFKFRNSITIDAHCVWGKVSRFHTLYRNIETYYYYKSCRILRTLICETFAPFFYQTFTGIGFQRFQLCETLVSKYETSYPSGTSNAMGVRLREVSDDNGQESPLSWHIRLINRLIKTNKDATIRDYFRLTDGPSNDAREAKKWK
jgi:hypothetical protein